MTFATEDIVDRLRAHDEYSDPASPAFCGKVADEIERLRAIAEFAAHSDGCEQPWHGIKRVCTCGLMELWEARRG